MLVAPGQVAPGLAEAVRGQAQEDRAAQRWPLIQAVRQVRPLPVHLKSVLPMRFRATAWGLVDLAQVAAVRRQALRAQVDQAERLRTLPRHLLGRRTKRMRATGFRALAHGQFEPLRVAAGEAPEN